MEGISEGRFPVRALDRRLRILRASSVPKVLGGMEPKSPTPGRWRPITRVPFELQVIPTQVLQIGVEAFQLSFRIWGTAAANLRRACISVFRSAVILGTIRSVRKRKASVEMEGSTFIDTLCDVSSGSRKSEQRSELNQDTSRD